MAQCFDPPPHVCLAGLRRVLVKAMERLDEEKFRKLMAYLSIPVTVVSGKKCRNSSCWMNPWLGEGAVLNAIDIKKAHENSVNATLRRGWDVLWEPDEWDCPVLRRDWQGLVDASSNLNVMYQSPVWFDHLQEMGEQERLAVAVRRDDSGRYTAVVPLRFARSPLEFRVCGNRLGSIPTRKVMLLGGSPLCPHDPGSLCELLQAALNAFPGAHGLGFPALQAGSELWHYLFHDPFVRGRLLAYAVDGVQEYHVQPLPPTYSEYLAHCSGKRRHNLRRQVRILQKHREGDLELRRIEGPADVPFYLEALASLGLIGEPRLLASRRSRSRFRDARLCRSLAERGLLRSYILCSGRQVIGCIGGVQYQGNYLANTIRYRPEYARFSPGAVMLFMAIQDLLTHRPVRLINYGFGEPNRRHHQSNVILEYASALLFRRTPANHLRLTGHQAFRSTVEWCKRLGRQRRIPPLAGKEQP